MEKTKDFEIRQALLDSSYVQHLKKDDEMTLVIEEFSLSETRIDLAIFNGHFHGFEIKSDKDTLRRLPKQIQGYEQVFEYPHLVVGTKHVEKVSEIIPPYWGIHVAEKKTGATILHEIRPPSPNTHQDPFEIARMLWKSETMTLLKKFGLLAGFKSKPCRILWRRLSDALPLSLLEEEVRQVLKSRGDWRADAKRKRCDERSRPSSMSSHYLSVHPLPQRICI